MWIYIHICSYVDIYNLVYVSTVVDIYNCEYVQLCISTIVDILNCGFECKAIDDFTVMTLHFLKYKIWHPKEGYHFLSKPCKHVHDTPLLNIQYDTPKWGVTVGYVSDDSRLLGMPHPFEKLVHI